MKKKSSITLMIWVLSVALGIAGCYAPVSPPQIIAQPQPPSVIPKATHHIVGKSVQNRPIMFAVVGQGLDTTFILSTIHGNESAGTPLVQRLAEYLQQHADLLQGRKVVLLPVVNPDGMAHNSRYNANGVDLNRNFAAANRRNSAQHGYSPLSEPEAAAIASLIRQYSPDRIVSIHQPSACIDYDGPAWALANHMAQHCDLPVRKLGAQSGSLGSYAGLTLNIPIITLELPGNTDSLNDDSLWQRYGPALVAAVIYPNRPK